MIDTFTQRLNVTDAVNVLRAHIAPTIVRILIYGIVFLLFWLLQSIFKDTAPGLGFTGVDNFLKTIPAWIYMSIGCSYLYWWFGKGGRVSLPFPLLDFTAWLFLSIITLASFAAPAFLPWWIGFPLLYALNPFFYLEELAEATQNKNLLEGNKVDDHGP